MLATYFSKRMYKNTIEQPVIDAVADASERFNRAKHYAFQTLMREAREGKKRHQDSLHVVLKQRYDIDDYFANSALQEANALFSSVQELRKQYIADKKDAIETAKNKLKSLKRKLTLKKKMLASLMEGKFKAKSCREDQCGRFYIVRYKRETKLYDNAYLFEHTYLKPEIKRIAHRIAMVEFRLKRLQKELADLQKYTGRVIFGSKNLFRKQFTIEKYTKDHELWKREYHRARYGRLAVSGRKDAKYGNFVFKYDVQSKTLHMHLPLGVYELRNLRFPYGQQEVDDAVTYRKNRGKPIAWAVEDHGDYYIVKATVHKPQRSEINYSKVDGVIGVDCNFDHFAWAETNDKGQLLSKGVFPFDMEHKTSGQITKIIEHEAMALVDLAVTKHKPIVIEQLDTTDSKSKLRYGNKKANRKMTQFAYDKMTSSIKARADKMGVAVFEVNPAYTSQIGKMKYMKPLGCSIHVAAAYVIARRGMGCKEKLPPAVFGLLPEKITSKHHWAHWSYVSKKLKGVRPHSFFEMKPSSRYSIRAWHELFDPGALADSGQKEIILRIANGA
ncbi:IS200/IS605 family accessory protein TnpB-related protein [Paenibacillus alkalitolerans]|uniref:IS200/IS605 family accessory protein TnpB-related protein n=1 Tax=Paenibacillus alkalitolerans TaxID=2799335 RepID=UPI0018F4F22C|nr:IS200/IS605 family accessory protein TnpB-related protein [Paenibacillus alkalitolerans]